VSVIENVPHPGLDSVIGFVTMPVEKVVPTLRDVWFVCDA
jgi:hypothetical protein